MDYPPTPALSFQSFKKITYFESGVKKDSLIFDIAFTDGDGDVGLNNGDTLPPFNQGSKYYYNLIVKYYERINGNLTQLTKNYPLSDGDTIQYNGRIPVLTPQSKNKGIKGNIIYGIDLGTGTIRGDAVKFEFILYDRALRKSNVAESPIIIIN